MREAVGKNDARMTLHSVMEVSDSLPKQYTTNTAGLFRPFNMPPRKTPLRKISKLSDIDSDNNSDLLLNKGVGSKMSTSYSSGFHWNSAGLSNHDFNTPQSVTRTPSTSFGNNSVTSCNSDRPVYGVTSNTSDMPTYIDNLFAQSLHTGMLV